MSPVEVPHLEAKDSYLVILAKRRHVKIRRPERHEVHEDIILRELLKVFVSRNRSFNLLDLCECCNEKVYIFLDEKLVNGICEVIRVLLELVETNHVV